MTSPESSVNELNATHASRGWRQVFLPTLISGILLWLAFPPMDFWPIAWIAPFFWIQLIQRADLGAKRPYRLIYLGGFLHWMLLLQWVRLPHWSATFGWILLSAYLAGYIVMFVGFARIAVHKFSVPLVVAVPVTWTGLELLRGHLFTGFSIALIGHTQVAWNALVQIADLSGAYGVSFLVLLGATAITRLITAGDRRSVRHLIYVLTIVFVVIGYGYWRTGIHQPTDAPEVKIALVQGSIDTEFDIDPSQKVDSFMHYRALSLEARGRHENLDLFIWPESMFSSDVPLITFDDDFYPPPDWQITKEDVRRGADVSKKMRKLIASELGTPLLAGTATSHFGKGSIHRFNSAIVIGRNGDLLGRYDKMHPVMFGEYVPLGDILPWLYTLTPMPSGLTAGKTPRSFEIAGLNYSPSICFENTVPHLIRKQVSAEMAAGQSPDVLVTITNDGWFWGSSLLDMHLCCGIFRAIELRRPMLIASNTGFSAWIDGSGKVLKKGPRRATDVLIASPRPDGRNSPYLSWGDSFAIVCLIWTAGMVAMAGTRGRTPKTK